MTLVLVLGLVLITRTTHSAEIGHYAPGLPNIRDLVMPGPGFYSVLYNYFYTSDRLNDGNGDEVNAVTINPRRGPGVTLGVEVDLDIYVLAPAFLWVSPWKIAGAKYGAFITPSFANSSVGASLATVTGRGGTAETSAFAPATSLCSRSGWAGRSPIGTSPLAMASTPRWANTTLRP
jgi:hypothetical protein